MNTLAEIPPHTSVVWGPLSEAHSDMVCEFPQCTTRARFQVYLDGVVLSDVWNAVCTFHKRQLVKNMHQGTLD